MPEETIPVKRGPGRPRKTAVAPKVESTPPADEWKTSEPEPVAVPADPRIGQECDPSWSAVGYGDGTSYLCRDGKIVERVY